MAWKIAKTYDTGYSGDLFKADFPYYVEMNSECVGWGGPEEMWFEIDMDGEYTTGEDGADSYEVLRFNNLEEAQALAERIHLEKKMQTRVIYQVVSEGIYREEYVSPIVRKKRRKDS